MGVKCPNPTSPEHNSARAAARAAGAKRFTGDPCRHGHQAQRFTVNGRCCQCAYDRKLRKGPRPPSPGFLARQEAKRAGLMFYQGEPCVRCQCRDRRTSNGRCAPCFRKYLDERKAREDYRAARRKAKKLRGLRPEEKRRRTEALTAKYRSDPVFRLHKTMGARMRRAVSRRTKDGQSWKGLVDYTPEDLRRHLERQFAKGMSWSNYGDWHIDHILPVSGFGVMEPGDEQFRACWALTNLRPMWGRDNIKKSARREHLL